MVRNKEDNKYYDPEIVSLLLTAVGPLGLICSVIGTVVSIMTWQNSNENEGNSLKRYELRRDSIYRELRLTLHSLQNSVATIEYSLDDLQEICHITQKLEERVRFGNNPLWLNRYQRDNYYRLQTRILSESQKIYSDMRIVEELLLSGEKNDLIVDFGSNTRTKIYIEDTVAPINKLLSQFGHYTTGDFIDKAIRVCHHTERTIEQLEDYLRKNYM